MHNLKNIDAHLPLGRLICVTGVSGSGKSTLVRGILYRNLRNLLRQSGRGKNCDASPEQTEGCSAIEGYGSLKRVLEVNQRPIGKTPRSCPATYTGIYDKIRNLFAQTPEAAMRGFSAGRFSFNVKDGRCPDCEGQGIQTVRMNFLPDVTVSCDRCNGQRFTPETLAVSYKDKTIADVLAMSVDEAVQFFDAHPSINRTLHLLQEVGLGYLTLGQQSPTLSGGEAQRLKLVTELAKARGEDTSVKDKTLYLLEEPTIGLHMADVEKLIRVLHRLVESGNTVLIIEHDLDVIAEADWILDLGPEGGDEGGYVVAEGPPTKVAEERQNSYTGKILSAFLEKRRKT